MGHLLFYCMYYIRERHCIQLKRIESGIGQRTEPVFLSQMQWKCIQKTHGFLLSPSLQYVPSSSSRAQVAHSTALDQQSFKRARVMLDSLRNLTFIILNTLPKSLAQSQNIQHQHNVFKGFVQKWSYWSVGLISLFFLEFFVSLNLGHFTCIDRCLQCIIVFCLQFV